MSGSMLLLTVSAVLIFSGLLQRVLDRMYLTDKQALLVVGAMIVGTFLPDISIGFLRINIGGGIIPLGVCVWLFVKANQPWERMRSIIGIVITAAAVYAISKLLPAEAEILSFDPIWVYGIAGGAIAWVLGRSRRCAFICGTAGILLADVTNAIVTRVQGADVPLVIGGAGIADAAVIGGVMGVLFCELLGEAIERMIRTVEARRRKNP